MKKLHLIPTMNPCELIARVRRCVPDGKPTNERGLRKLVREMDAVAAEVKRAGARSCEEMEAA